VSPRLAILSTHPIQYYAPLFRRLAERSVLDVHVFYGWDGPSDGAYDPGFGDEVTWDIPLREGYPHTMLDNASRDPGTHHFRGLVNPDLVPSVRAWEPDALLVFGWNYWSHLKALITFSGELPIFFRGDSTLIDETPGPRQWLRRLWLRGVYQTVDVALYVGTNNRDYFEAHGLDDADLEWVPHAIDNDRFADPDGSLAEEASAWKKDLDIPDDACTFVFAGKLSRKKAPDVLIEAFLGLQPSDGSNPHLVIAGSGSEMETLQEQTASCPCIHFIGFQNQSRMPVVYRLGEVVVLPSRGPGETWGLAINEAMASGRAVVASTQVGCAPDLITSGENGFVFESGAVGELRRELQTLADDPSLRRSMGRASQRRIRDWSIDAAAQHLEEAVLEHLSVTETTSA